MHFVVIARGAGFLGWYCLGRRSLNWTAVGISLRLGGLRLLLDCFALESRKLGAVTKQLLNQSSLRLDRAALFYDQKGHQTVGNQEQYGEDWKHGVLRFRLNFRRTENCRHLRPR